MLSERSKWIVFFVVAAVCSCGGPKNRPPIAVLDGPSSGRINEALVFDCSGSTDLDGIVAACSFDFGDGSSASDVFSAVHAYSSAGIYTVTLTVTDDDGATSSISKQISIADNVPPVAVLSSPSSGAIGEPVSFDASASYDPDGRVVKYSYDFGDGTSPVTGVVAAASHAYTQAGNYVITLTVTDDDGATSSISKQISIADNVPPVAALSSPSSGVTSEPVAFDASASYDPDGRVVKYSYDFGDGTPPVEGTISGVSHTYTTEGDYIVTLTVTDDDGATNTVSRLISIASLASVSDPPVACFTGPTTASTNEAVFFDASCSTSGSGTIISYVFDFGDSVTATGEVVTHTYTTRGTYTVTLTVTARLSDGSTLENTTSHQIVVSDSTVAITLVTPDSGSILGGEWITIKGYGFTTTPDTTIFLGTAQVTDFTVVDSTTIVALTPASETPGTVDLKVSNSNGVAIYRNAYTYLLSGNLADLTFCPEDASSGGTSLGFAVNDDDAGKLLTLPMDVKFFGVVFPEGQTINVTSNGWLSFTELLRADFENNPIPDPSNPDYMVAPFFDDLNAGITGQVYYKVTGTAPNRVFTIEWINFTDNASLSETFDFQVNFYESSGDIKFQYMNSPFMGDYGSAQEASIGVQKDSATGVEASFNTAVKGLVPGGRVYVFRYLNGEYSLYTDTTLTVYAVDPPLEGDLLTDGSYIITFSKPVNTGTAVAGSTIKMEDATVPSSVTFTISALGDKSILQLTPNSRLIWGHTYNVTVTSGLQDVVGNPFSQDPMEVACGVISNPEPFTGTFIGEPSVVDTSASIPGGGNPKGIAVYGDTLFVAKDNNLFFSYDADSLSPLDVVLVPGASVTLWDVAVHPSGLTAYVTSDGDSTVRVIDISDPLNLAQTASIPVTGASPAGVAVTPDGLTVCVAGNADDNLYVIDAQTLTYTTVALSAGCGPYYVAAATDSSTAYVTCNNNNSVDVVDLTTGSVTANVALPGCGPRGIAITPDGSSLYVGCTNTDTVEVIDTATNTNTETIAGFSFWAWLENVAITPDGMYALVTDGNNDEVGVIDIATNTVRWLISGGGGPFDVTVRDDTYRTVYVTNYNDNTISMIR